MIWYLNVFMVSIFNMFILAELSRDENFNLKDTSCDNHMIRIIPNNDNILIQKGDTISTTGMTTIATIMTTTTMVFTTRTMSGYIILLL